MIDSVQCSALLDRLAGCDSDKSVVAAAAAMLLGALSASLQLLSTLSSHMSIDFSI